MSPFVSRQSSATLPVHNPSISLSVLPTTAQNDFSFSQSRKSNLFSHRLHDSRASNLLDRPHGSYLPRMTLMSALEQNQNQERHSTTLTYHSPTTRDSAILRGTNGGGGQLNESLLHGEHNDHNNNDYDL